MADRVFAIGDIHGCANALEALLGAIDLQPGDTLVPLGDYIDRGPQSAEVVEMLGNLAGSCHLVPLLGNHELIMKEALSNGQQFQFWMGCGGDATVASYGGSVRNIPQHHHVFFQNCRSFYETDHHIFVHASYLPDLPMAEQDPEIIFWEHLTHEVPPPHFSGKKVIVGHTPQIDGEIYDMGHLMLIDTFCFGGKWLTALEVNSGEIWQADNYGNLREK
ncbi:MAG: metallophosphoesterase [Planctomycetota bacterium]|nr:metallophosphoesterase [Planctomycetota bacterium]